jgi:hypothetical protein
MELYTTTNLIAGGIDVESDTIISGGHERVVGQNTKWYMRNKFLQLKHLSTSSTVNEKTLLKIVGLKLPLTFGKKMVFFDDDKKNMPVMSNTESNSVKHDKAIYVLKERINESIDITVKRLIVEYNLRAPLFWVLGDIIKFLAHVHRTKKPDSKKIKISPDMAVLIEKIWNGKKYFSYVVNSDEVPSNMIELMLHLLDTVEKLKPPKGEWMEPHLEIIKYPVLFENNIEKKIDDVKKNMIQEGKNIDVVKDHIFVILTIENLLINHIDNIEKYFIQSAKNVCKILNSLKKFFKKKL